MPELSTDPAASRFSLFAVRKNDSQPLIQVDMTWERLMIDIVTPFEAGELFFVDGAPVRATDIDRMKILLQGQNFMPTFHQLHWSMRSAQTEKKETLAKQYHTFMEALLRENCTDVTSQVISAFRTAVKPKLSDRLPDRTMLFDAAIKLVIEGTKAAFAQH